MSDSQKLIREVIVAHPERRAMGCNGCGWLASDTERYADHLAAEIDKALGGLAAEWGVVVAYPPRPDDGYPGAVVTLDSCRLREAAEYFKRTKYPEDDYEIRSRWVSGWSEVQR